ncbi:nuclease-related domain-containing protein [Microbacterium sp. APC 3898]|uniref:Nuclease-related domain-containing protein n=1 Tax=Planococcus notacanthi TaxID=3035188 RepID=A0ABT7ZIL4_9BACL|nr:MULTISPECIES: nuclease-related domain-containing protein [Terrabacteria group]MDN3426991.1 nuclease-related domain-containing protein [Planococcus sp. APC 4016]MDN3499861.1 nuclease-related domain-containing protein [Microbacterium sp. APC 3898]
MSKKEMGLLSETESLERLLYRLPENHPKRQFLQVELFRTAAGKRGEKRLEQKLKEFRLAENHHFLRNVCLSKGEWRIQMDGLLLTERGAIIIESKNISGQLFFDDKTGEFSRIDLEGIRTVMEDPTVQLNKHIRFLSLFFKQHKINLPIDGIVVFTSKYCEFMTKPKMRYVCKNYQLIDYLFTILDTFPQQATPQNLQKIDKPLQKFQTPYNRYPLCQQYFIDPNELQTGILCAACKKHSMVRKHKSGWVCERCQLVDPLALECAVQEYFSLVHPQLSNRQLRQFCNIDSPYLASRLLAAFDLEPIGALRNRSYQIKEETVAFRPW